MSLSHAYFQDQLVSNQRLTPAEQAALEEHLAACPECRAYAALHHTLLATLPYPTKAPRHSEREIREKIAAANARIQRRRWPETLFHNTLALASMTAALLLLVVAFHFIPRMIPGHQSHLHPAAMQGPSATQPLTPARPTPSPTATPSLSLSSVFPLDPGTTWVYSVVAYSQAGNDPEKILQETSRIEERLVETQSIPPYTVLHIQANRSILSADPGWDENQTVGPYEYWYVIKDNQVFLTYDNPAVTPIDLNKILMAYQFPMAAGSEWCHNPARKGSVENPTPAPNAPCLYQRVVKSVGPYQSPIGELKSCYEIHDVAASGDVISQFCDGIGLVAETYNHSGTAFGDQQDLIQFINGKDSAAQVAPTPSPSGAPAGAGESLVSPDGQWTARYQKETGQITLQNAQGQPTPVAVGGQNQYLIPGPWSPDSRYLLIWQGMNSASAQADGFPLWSLDVSAGVAYPLSKATLLNEAYLAWAPDGHALVFTNGGYRSAQVGKRLSLYTPASQQVADLVPEEKLVPGAVAWSRNGTHIAFAAVDAALTGQDRADFMGWENPAIQARRIYLIDPQTSQYQRLNAADAYQDAPRWGQAGRLYFVQLDGEQARVMAADPTTGAAQALDGCQAARPEAAGYYGQVDWSALFAACPATAASATAASATAPILTPVSAQSLVPAVAAQGQMAYTGIGSRLAAIDISQPAAPQLVAQSEDLPGVVMKVLILPDSAAGSRVVVSAGRYLAVLDASTPGALGLITQSKLPGPINALIYDISTSTLYAGGTLLSNPALGYITRLDASAPDVLQLQETAQLAAPVQSLALGKFTLYAALRGQSPGVAALPLEGSRIGAPREVIPGVTVASMTAVGDLLYLGAQGQMLAYTITQPTRPEAAWQITQSGGAAIPGTIFGFEVRPDVIYAAGLDASGKSFHLALTPPVQIVTGSMVDTASCVAVADGKMLVAGDPLAIYDSLNLDTLPLLGAFTPANP